MFTDGADVIAFDPAVLGLNERASPRQGKLSVDLEGIGGHIVSTLGDTPYPSPAVLGLMYVSNSVSGLEKHTKHTAPEKHSRGQR